MNAIDNDQNRVLRQLFKEVDPAMRRRIRARREEVHLSQQALAMAVTDLGSAMHQTAIAKIETGTRSVTVTELWAIAVALRCDVADLIIFPRLMTREEALRRARHDLFGIKHQLIEANVAKAEVLNTIRELGSELARGAS